MEQMPSFWRNQPLDIIGSLLSCPLGTVSQMKLDEREKKNQTQAHTLAHDMKQELSGSLCFVTWYCFQLEDFTPFLALYTYT